MAWPAKPRSLQEADSYSRLRHGQRVLLIGDALSARIVFNNLVGRNFQPKEKAAVGSAVSWRTLRDTCAEYRSYLQYMEQDLSVAIGPDTLSVEIMEKEESHV